jgi:hypothetical protein
MNRLFMPERSTGAPSEVYFPSNILPSTEFRSTVNARHGRLQTVFMDHGIQTAHTKLTPFYCTIAHELKGRGKKTESI